MAAMPKTLMQSVVAQLQKERTRLEDELHRVTGLLALQRLLDEQAVSRGWMVKVAPLTLRAPETAMLELNVNSGLKGGR